MTLLKHGFPRIVESYSDPRAGVKRGSALRWPYEEQRHVAQQGQAQRSQVLDAPKKLGLLTSTTWLVKCDSLSNKGNSRSSFKLSKHRARGSEHRRADMVYFYYSMSTGGE